MKIYILAVLLGVVCFASAQQNPTGWNYNPYLYFPYSALSPPAQETAEVAAARASHLAAHAAAARGRRSIPDSPEVWAAKVEHYRAYAAAAAANGVVSTLPTLYTNEVAAARAAHFAAHAAAAARGKRSVADAPDVAAAKLEHIRAHAAAAAANGVVSSLRYLEPVAVWGPPQPVQDTPEVAAARAAHMAALAAARGKRSVQDTPEVMAATIEHYRAYNAAATANGFPMTLLPARYANMPFGMPQPVQETAEVAAARRAHMAALAHATARG
ncbi:pupal cuticle protein-like [Daphnia pulex]|uniref:pupal cuticle protein-like n=1 Tax=Daphnia pulex TaxID=6669 RepID=UPI001EDF9453|nr:pupal cuticle protein-like [Daphnia pulex]